MKKFALAAAFALIAGAASADPVEGVWQTQVDDGAYAHITMSPCGSKICGVISRAYRNGSQIQSDTVGKRIVWDMTPGDGGRYSGGKIWRPSNGKTYSSKMVLSGSSLKVSGCIGPICKSQTWSRVK